MIGCGRAGDRGGGTIEGVARVNSCRIHEHLSTTAAGNDIHALGAKYLSVALAKRPNLRALNLSGQWFAVSEYGAMIWSRSLQRRQKEGEDEKGDRQSTDRIRMTDRDMGIKLEAEIAAKNERRYRDGWQ